MFGIIVAIIIIIYLVYSSISNSIEDGKGKRLFKDESTNTYLDHNGVSRDLKTDKYRSITVDYNGDRHLWGKDIGDINLSRNKRIEEYEHYKRNPIKGRTTVYWEPSPIYKLGERNVLGKRYKDIETGDIYVVRSNNWKHYYVEINKLKVIRYTDSQKRMLEEHNNYSRKKEHEDVATFQSLIERQRNDETFIGDPSNGIPTYSKTLEDNWIPEKIYY